MKILETNICERYNEIGELNHFSCVKHQEESQPLQEKFNAINIP